MRRLLCLALLLFSALALPAWALGGTFTLHPSGFGEHSYSAWKGQQGLEGSTGNKNQALYFQKDTPTPTFAAGVAVFKGFEGMSTSAVLPLEFWYVPPFHDEKTWTPGAVTSTTEPTFEKAAISSSLNGRTWTRLTDGKNGIPADEPTRVVREDPEREGLLYAGTEFGMYVSLNDGASWMKFNNNLPVVPIPTVCGAGRVGAMRRSLSTLSRRASGTCWNSST